MKFNAPYLILIGGEKDPTYAKTGYGLVKWRRELVAGQLRFPDCELDLGVPDLSVIDAANQGVGSLVIGTATIGGIIPDDWWTVIIEAVDHGLDIINGLHTKLKDNPKIIDRAKSSGSRLLDIRVPPSNIPVGSGKKRSGQRLLTVATDCACGKKYTALSMNDTMRRAGINSTFRATGQTGIMISGEGIPIDAVTADFISGAAEMLTPDNEPNHWDVIEGQGSLFHPGYSGVSLGLLNGSQPDAFIMCHDATRMVISGWKHYSLPSVKECIDLHIQLGRITNPDIACVGISLNTSGLSMDERDSYLNVLRKETSLPCVDPLIDGCDDILLHMKKIFSF